MESWDSHLWVMKIRDSAVEVLLVLLQKLQSFLFFLNLFCKFRESHGGYRQVPNSSVFEPILSQVLRKLQCLLFLFTVPLGCLSPSCPLPMKGQEIIWGVQDGAHLHHISAQSPLKETSGELSDCDAVPDFG